MKQNQCVKEERKWDKPMVVAFKMVPVEADSVKEPMDVFTTPQKEEEPKKSCCMVM